MQITIVPQTQEQFDRLMAFLEKDHAAFVADLERETKRNEVLMNAINNALEYFASISGPKH